MDQGLLWHDDSGKSLEEKVKQATQRYRKKFGTPPDICYVHPSALRDRGPQRVGEVQVAALPSVLRHHFWIGQEQENGLGGHPEFPQLCPQYGLTRK